MICDAFGLFDTINKSFCLYAASSKTAWKRSPISGRISQIWAPSCRTLNRNRTRNVSDCSSWGLYCEARLTLIGWSMWRLRKALAAIRCTNCRVTRITGSRDQAICWRRARARCEGCGRSAAAGWQPMDSWTFAMRMRRSHRPGWIC